MSDYGNHCIYRANLKTSMVDLYAGAAGQPGFQDSSTLKAARFERPAQMSIDPENGIVYVADVRNQRIRALFPNGSVSTTAGSGHKGHINDSGRYATFCSPCGLSVLFLCVSAVLCD
jgi:DNA-binding beta-propeller fold protein YncE